MALAQEPVALANDDLFHKVEAKVDLIRKIADLQPTNATANLAVESAPARSTAPDETVEILRLVATFFFSFWLIFRAVVAWLFDVVKDLFFAFPLMVSLVVVGLAGLCAVYVIRSGHRNKQQLLLSDVVECRENVYRILADRQEHQNFHIRDQISFRVCPTSKMARKRIQMAVWPLVVEDIRQDTRIDKRVVAVAATATGAGEKREYWSWVDAADPAPGHVRFSTSGSGITTTHNGQ
jgi:hypothetical protein